MNGYLVAEAWIRRAAREVADPTASNVADAHQLVGQLRFLVDLGLQGVADAALFDTPGKAARARASRALGAWRSDGPSPMGRRARWTETDRAMIYADYGRCCHLCGLPVGEDFALDHVVPLAQGGADRLGNLAPAHAECNGKKGARTPVFFKSDPLAGLTYRTETERGRILAQVADHMVVRVEGVDGLRLVALADATSWSFA